MDHRKAEARLSASRDNRPAIDYERMNREFPKQKRRLTLALKSGDYDRVIKTCAQTVAEWNEIGAWPDDWAHWERALDDAYWTARQKYIAGETETRPVAVSLRELPLIADLIGDGR